MTEASRYLRALAQQSARVYTPHPDCRAMLLAGSAAAGEADFRSDLDLILYYAALPTEEALAEARRRNGGGERLWVNDSRAEGAVVEAYNAGGVQVQIVHTTVGRWEKTLDDVLERLDLEPTLQKALSGLEEGVALHGEALIEGWKARLADYPAALAEAMVRKHLQFFPLWGMQEYFAPRDAWLWQQQTLLEAAQNLLGVLAGVNRVYYSTFQFKRMRKFIERLRHKPGGLAERLEGLVGADPAAGARELERLVAEVLELVEAHLPQVDTARLRGRIGWRQPAWALPQPEA